MHAKKFSNNELVSEQKFSLEENKLTEGGYDLKYQVSPQDWKLELKASLEETDDLLLNSTKEEKYD
eukprot:CAMPEP_0202971912 /NCGR_PEP_ID=MMETSP1396-20130829/32046_1 /ASSEMBLY_ACC=CAM_ASM_000872 /TAXON_ID= /ORGANISM="Pseudokeronopsis sp., Strain Brazil" /LENGTH=65 /DNA_ID=CAMNT_0049701793 /DNA_START=173 /DNA_END=370 /DNA_ORIENTATION=-